MLILFIYYDIKNHKIKKAIAILKKIFDFRAWKEWKIDLYEKLHSDLKTRCLEINYEKSENILPAGF